jgi:integrase
VTALAVPACLPAVPGADDGRVTRLWEAIGEEFLAVMSWDPARQVVIFPKDHPLLGWKECAVSGCTAVACSGHGFCTTCQERWAGTAGMSAAEFSAIPRARLLIRGVEIAPCAVGGCQRPSASAQVGLCNAHANQRKNILRLPLEEFLGHPGVVPLPSFGPCSVAACTRDREGLHPYCHRHGARLREEKKKDPRLDVEAWQRTMPAVVEGGKVSLRGLSPLVVAEALYGLQERTREDIKTTHVQFRPYCDTLRRAEAVSIADLIGTRKPARQAKLEKSFVRSARRLEMTPETERHKDEWDLFVFGYAGTLTFTGISQPWLREAVKRWAFDDLPRRRGGGVANIAQEKVRAIGWLSESLRLQRADHGEAVRALGREDISAFCSRMAFLAERGQISATLRGTFCRRARLVLDRCRRMGLTRRGEPLHGLPDDFTFLPEDMPDRPEDDDGAGADLPLEVMRVLTAHLDALEASSREVRVAVELMMDTGRRTGEVASLPLDCLESDPGGKPVLIYDNHKAHREARRLPIATETAAIIAGQQERVRARFPGTPDPQLWLLPAETRNPAGRRHMAGDRITNCHRDWVNALPDIAVPTAVSIEGSLVTKMLPFDREKIFPYAYRHTYAQRHADAGVDVTVLKELMDHRLLSTTQGYYRVRDERRREAVDRVTAMQFDRHGNRVWRQARQLLASEHQRLAVGEVAVPFGRCSEPSNVAADGQDCPLRFRCAGCDHFGTDVSYLPDLERYLADQLRHRERLRAAVDADEWARAEAMPSDAEITRIRRLIERMKSDLDDLADAERAEIEDAVATIRRSRARITHLGLPKVRPPLPDLHAERNA